MNEILHAELPEGDPNVVSWKMYNSLAIDYNRRGWEIERLQRRLAVVVAALEAAPEVPTTRTYEEGKAWVQLTYDYEQWYNGPRQAALKERE